MANSARISVDMEFADGETRTIKPLTIKRLRKFMKIVEALSTTEAGKMTEVDITNMMEAAAIVIDQVDPDLAADKEKLEDVIDVDIFWKLIQVAMGNKIQDPEE